MKDKDNAAAMVVSTIMQKATVTAREQFLRRIAWLDDVDYDAQDDLFKRVVMPKKQQNKQEELAADEEESKSIIQFRAEDLKNIHILMHELINNPANVVIEASYVESNNESSVRLKKGAQILIKREDPGEEHVFTLKRSMTLATDGEELKLILDTKRKLGTGGKDKENMARGSFKTVKTAWRLDSDDQVPIPSVTKVQKIDKDNAQGIVREISTIKQIAKLLTDDERKYFDVADYAILRINNKGYNKLLSHAPRGQSLSSFLRGEEGKDKEIIKDLALQLLQAVKIMHDKNVIHRDLKPDNILVFNEGGKWRLKLTDFGLTIVDDGKLEAKGAAGTAGFLPPELALEYYRMGANAALLYGSHLRSKCSDEEHRATMRSQYEGRILVDKKADVWAMGLILMEMLTGEKLHGSINYSTKEEVSQKHENIEKYIEELGLNILLSYPKARVDAETALTILRPKLVNNEIFNVVERYNLADDTVLNSTKAVGHEEPGSLESIVTVGMERDPSDDDTVLYGTKSMDHAEPGSLESMVTVGMERDPSDDDTVLYDTEPAEDEGKMSLKEAASRIVGRYQEPSRELQHLDTTSGTLLYNKRLNSSLSYKRSTQSKESVQSKESAPFISDLESGESTDNSSPSKKNP